jgi:hypothetical protein
LTGSRTILYHLFVIGMSQSRLTHTQKDTTMSDSFQIRRDLLAMAKDVLMQEWQTKTKSLETEYEQEVLRRSIMESSFTISYPKISPAPTADDIINMAAKLNAWVSAQSPGMYKKLKADLENADSQRPDKTHEISPDIKGQYLLTVKANASSSIHPGKWEKTVNSRKEAESMAHDWCDATRQVESPKWYINPDTFDACWNHDNIFFSIREL